MFRFDRGQLDVFEAMTEDIIRRPVSTPFSEPTAFPAVRSAPVDLADLGDTGVVAVDADTGESN